MKDSIRDALIEEIAHETAHFTAAPAAFFDAWKSGVALAGRHLFGRGTHADLEHATSVWDLCPNVQLIDHAIGVMSSGEKRFLATLVSFYNARMMAADSLSASASVALPTWVGWT